MERGLDGAVDVATGTGVIGTVGGTKSKVTKCLDLQRVFRTDNVCTGEWHTRQDLRINLDEEGLSLLDDEKANEEGWSKVEIEEINRSFFILPPLENPHRYWY